MALSNYPKKTKYAYLDEVFALINGVITPLVVAGWRVVVDDPAGDDSGRQRTFYNFSTIATEIVEEKVYTSNNHCLSMLLGDYLNLDGVAAGFAASDLFIRSYGTYVVPSLGNWTDWAGHSFEDAVLRFAQADILLPGTASGSSGSPVLTGTGTNWNTVNVQNTAFQDSSTIKIGNETKVILSIDSETQITLTTNLAANHTTDVVRWVRPAEDIYVREYSGTSDNKLIVFDNVDLTGATMPSRFDTISEFIANCKSYDKETTIWTDGVKIGERTS